MFQLLALDGSGYQNEVLPYKPFLDSQLRLYWDLKALESRRPLEFMDHPSSLSLARYSHDTARGHRLYSLHCGGPRAVAGWPWLLQMRRPSPCSMWLQCPAPQSKLSAEATTAAPAICKVVNPQSLHCLNLSDCVWWHGMPSEGAAMTLTHWHAARPHALGAWLARDDCSLVRTLMR